MVGLQVDVADIVLAGTGITFETLASCGLIALVQCKPGKPLYHVVIPWVLLSWMSEQLGASRYGATPKLPPGGRELIQNIAWMLNSQHDVSRPSMFLHHDQSWKAWEQFGMVAYAMMMNAHVLMSSVTGKTTIPLATFHRGLMIGPAPETECIDVTPVVVCEVKEPIRSGCCVYHAWDNHEEIHMPDPHVVILNGVNGKAVDGIHVSANGIVAVAQAKDADEKPSAGDTMLMAAIKEVDASWGSRVGLLISRTSSWTLCDVASVSVPGDSCESVCSSGLADEDTAGDVLTDTDSEELHEHATATSSCSYCPVEKVVLRPGYLDRLVCPVVALDWRTVKNYWPGLHLHPLVNPVFPINHPLVTRTALSQRLVATKLASESEDGLHVTVDIRYLSAAILAERELTGEFLSEADLLQRMTPYKPLKSWQHLFDAALRRQLLKGGAGHFVTPHTLTLDPTIVFWPFTRRDS